jgi:hypothetical protein
MAVQQETSEGQNLFILESFFQAEGKITGAGFIVF